MNIYEKYKDVSFENGKFLSDKSYAYDTVYFLANFLNDYQEKGCFKRKKWRKALYEYIVDKFHLYNRGDGVENYYTESRWVFIYSKTIKEDVKDNLVIIDQEILDFITKKMENAYIYLYLLCYYTLKNSNCFSLYEEFCLSDKLDKKEKLIKIYLKLSELNKSVKDSEQWAKQNTEYILNVLNFLNYQPKVSRELTFDYSLIRNPKMISVNVKGTKTSHEKDNKYFNDFDFTYVEEMLKDYIIYKGEKIDE